MMKSDNMTNGIEVDMDNSVDPELAKSDAYSTENSSMGPQDDDTTVVKESVEDAKYQNSKRTISIVVGLAMLVGVVCGIVALVNFMDEGDIQFVQQANSNLAEISPEELALHNTEDDCWMALYGNVYDFTRYAQRHPDGPEDIIALAGTDGTAEYARFHSFSPLKTVETHLVGTLTTANETLYEDLKKFKGYGSSASDSSSSSSNSGD